MLKTLADDHHVSFNQDASTINFGHNDGYFVIFLNGANIEHRLICDGSEITIVEKLYRKQLTLSVSSLRPKVLVCRKGRNVIFSSPSFAENILSVRLNSKRIVICMERSIVIWDIINWRKLHEISGMPANVKGLVDLCPDDTSILAYPIFDGKGLVNVYDADTLQPIHSIHAHDCQIAAIRLNKNGTLLATASEKGTVIRVFSVRRAELLFEFTRGQMRSAMIYSLAFSEDSRYLASSGSTGTVHLYRLDEPLNTNIYPDTLTGMCTNFLWNQAMTYAPGVVRPKSVARCRLPGAPDFENVVALKIIDHYLYILIVSKEGYYYVFQYDPEETECQLVQQEHISPDVESPIKRAGLPQLNSERRSSVPTVLTPSKGDVLEPFEVPDELAEEEHDKKKSPAQSRIVVAMDKLDVQGEGEKKKVGTEMKLPVEILPGGPVKQNMYPSLPDVETMDLKLKAQELSSEESEDASSDVSDRCSSLPEASERVQEPSKMLEISKVDLKPVVVKPDSSEESEGEPSSSSSHSGPPQKLQEPSLHKEHPEPSKATFQAVYSNDSEDSDSDEWAQEAQAEKKPLSFIPVIKDEPSKAKVQPEPQKPQIFGVCGASVKTQPMAPQPKTDLPSNTLEAGSEVPVGLLKPAKLVQPKPAPPKTPFPTKKPPSVLVAPGQKSMPTPAPQKACVLVKEAIPVSTELVAVEKSMSKPAPPKDPVPVKEPVSAPFNSDSTLMSKAIKEVTFRIPSPVKTQDKPNIAEPKKIDVLPKAAEPKKPDPVRLAPVTVPPKAEILEKALTEDKKPSKLVEAIPPTKSQTAYHEEPSTIPPVPPRTRKSSLQLIAEKNLTATKTAPETPDTAPPKIPTVAPPPFFGSGNAQWKLSETYKNSPAKPMASFEPIKLIESPKPNLSSLPAFQPLKTPTPVKEQKAVSSPPKPKLEKAKKNLTEAFNATKENPGLLSLSPKDMPSPLMSVIKPQSAKLPAPPPLLEPSRNLSKEVTTKVFPTSPASSQPASVPSPVFDPFDIPDFEKLADLASASDDEFSDTPPEVDELTMELHNSPQKPVVKPQNQDSAILPPKGEPSMVMAKASPQKTAPKADFDLDSVQLTSEDEIPTSPPAVRKKSKELKKSKKVKKEKNRSKKSSTSSESMSIKSSSSTDSL
ncbi:hypothetical protein L596_013796 [Steinernema carpocapsae]|uniref:Uncharacterized protein n=1 Tax=Steinernema carpocapsae TaxID=34508 RepID=A0A4U5P187_STECR|nr:hypothetical protein L596_013796 [Steinernema carpocapsae]